MNDTSRNLTVREILTYFGFLAAFLMPVLTDLTGIQNPTVVWIAKAVSISAVSLGVIGFLFKALWRPWQLFPLLAASIMLVNVYPKVNSPLIKNLAIALGVGCIFWSLRNIARMSKEPRKPTANVYIIFILLSIALFGPLFFYFVYRLTTYEQHS